MKTKVHFLSAVLAAVLFGGAIPLCGQITPVTAVNAAAGDLILGFAQPQSGATGANQNIEVDLGSYSQYAGLAAGTSVVVTNIAADLAATYGPNWNQNVTLAWGVVRTGGAADSSHPDAVIGKINNNPAGGATAPYAIGSTNSVQNPAKALNSGNATTGLIHKGYPANADAYDGLKNPPYTSANNSSVAIVPTINTTSWTTLGTSPAQVFSAGSVNADFTLANFQQETAFPFTGGVASNSYRVVDLFLLKFVASGNVTETYVGSFALQANGAITFSTSAQHFSDAVTPPTITQQPPAQTNAAVGQAVSLSVTATGQGTITYQWREGGMPLSDSGDGRITGTQTATLHFSSVNTGDSGAYDVLVSNSVGQQVLSNTAQLTITQPLAPTITTQPASQTVTAGSNVTFSVVATGTTPLSYQWNKDGSPITGATNSSLSLNNVTAADAASYTVVVSNSIGNTTSNAAVLTVNTGPSITTQPASQTVTAGSSVTFSVVAAGTPPFSYQWSKDGSPITGATNSSFTIAATADADAGSYTVVVTNLVGSVTSDPVVLVVNDPAAITTQPADQSAAWGDNVTFTVAAIGTAPLSYQWSKNGAPIAGATEASLTLLSVTSADSASYTVVVSNVAGSATSNAATLTVAPPIPPSIATQPVSQTVFVGESVTFTVAAIGTAPLGYQWSKDNTPIVGATSASLTLSNLATTDSGNYTVVVSSPFGTATSNAAMLTVQPGLRPPSITTQPVGETVYETTSVTFTVAAVGAATLNYQWLKNGTAINGATNPTLTLNNITVADAGSYTVTVTNSVGTASSNAAVLTVTVGPPPPVITSQPSGQTAYEQTSVTFSVAATGTGTLTYQWLKNGTAIAGATSAIHTISSVTVADAGSYTVVVSDGNPSTSNAAVLTVHAGPPPPTITTQPVGNTVLVGASVSFNVTATGLGTLTYQWMKNGASIAGATGAAYGIANAALTDAGSYTVAVSNGNTTVSNAAVLTVNPLPPAPTITAQPVGATVYEGVRVSFSVMATGTGTLTYQWLKNGTAITGATNTTYVLPSVTVADSGSFTVVVSNGNSTTSNAAVLVVNAGPPPPTITTQPASQTVFEGTSVTFTVVASGTGTLTYQWSKNGSPISGATSASLTFASAAQTDAGSYTVVVTNGNSTTSNAAVLTVNPTPPPSAPTAKAANPVTYTGFTANWSSVTGATDYRLDVATDSGFSAYVTAGYQDQDAGANTSLVVTGLTPGTTYYYRVRAANSSGASPNSATITVTTLAPTTPAITTPNATAFTVGLPGAFTVQASGAPAPTFSAPDAPSWTTLDPVTGLLKGTPPVGTSGGLFAFVITASNGAATPATQTFTLRVQPVPTSTSPLTVTTLAGLAGVVGGVNGTGAVARFNSPLGIVTDASGNIYVADIDNDVIRKVTPAGIVSTLAGQMGVAGSADGAGSVATFHRPSGVAIDENGALYVADSLNHTIRKIMPDGTVSTVAGQAGNSGSTDTDTGKNTVGLFNAPQAVAVEILSSGDLLFVADTNNNTIRQIVLATGAVSTFAGKANVAGSADGTGSAARFNGPTGLAINPSGTLFVADSDSNTIRQITTSGAVTTLAGMAGSYAAADGLGAAARFNGPTALAVDGTGANLYVLDTDNHTVRKIATASGLVTTVAGWAGSPGSADGTGDAARFDFPAGIAMSPSGVVIADSSNDTLRNGTFTTGVAITTQPVSQTVAAGTKATFTVVASGQPAPTYQWRRNGAAISGATASSYDIASAQAADTGNYDVVVGNSMGSVTSQTAVLTVTTAVPAVSPSAGGGGAPSLWFLGCLALVTVLRATMRRTRRGE